MPSHFLKTETCVNYSLSLLLALTRLSPASWAEVVNLLSSERLFHFNLMWGEFYCAFLLQHAVLYIRNTPGCLTYDIFFLLILTWHFYAGAGGKQSMLQTVVLLKLTDWSILLLSLHLFPKESFQTVCSSLEYLSLQVEIKTGGLQCKTYFFSILKLGLHANLATLDKMF